MLRVQSTTQFFKTLARSHNELTIPYFTNLMLFCACLFHSCCQCIKVMPDLQHVHRSNQNDLKNELKSAKIQYSATYSTRLLMIKKTNKYHNNTLKICSFIGE